MSPNLSLVVFILLIGFSGCQNRNEWIDKIPKPWTLSKTDISELLPEFHSRFPNFYDRLRAFSLWQLGKPYELFKLGEEKEPDLDPIIRLDVSDCTVHILTSLAFIQSKSWDEARENMIKIHYKNHRPEYNTRWHFTSERILSHPETVDITKNLISKENLVNKNLTLNQKKDGQELLDLNWKKEISFSYIPNFMINKELMDRLPYICGVAFIRESHFLLGAAIAHEGMIIDNKFLLHASKIEGKTTKVDLLKYYFSNSDGIFDGIMIYKFMPMSK